MIIMAMTIVLVRDADECNGDARYGEVANLCVCVYGLCEY